MKLSEILILGTHDSTSYGTKWPLSIFAKCQDITLEEQLSLGVRYFDIRLNRDTKGMTCYHGIACCHITWKEVLKIFERFIRLNPEEYVLIRVYRADDQTGKRQITNQAWERIFYQESGNRINVVTEDIEESELRGKINVINVNWNKMLPITDAGGFSLNCKDEDIKALISNCNSLSNSDIKTTKMISTHADGSFKLFNNIKYLNRIPYPRGFFKMFNKEVHCLTIANQGIYVFDFVDKVNKIAINKILK